MNYRAEYEIVNDIAEALMKGIQPTLVSGDDISIDGLFIGDTSAMKIKKVVVNYPATIVFWEDGTKTVVKDDNKLKIRQDWEWYGVAMALLKKTFGNEYHKIIEDGLNKMEIQKVVR